MIVSEYKQQIANTDYFEKVVTLSLSRNQWNSANTWVQTMSLKDNERLGKEWFEDLYWLVMTPISHKVNFSDVNYSHDEEIPCEIPRELLRMLIFSIGRIAYDVNVKPQTAISAQEMVEKLKLQLKEVLPADDKWFKYNF